jgi:hypothetical protein
VLVIDAMTHPFVCDCMYLTLFKSAVVFVERKAMMKYSRMQYFKYSRMEKLIAPGSIDLPSWV